MLTQKQSSNENIYTAPTVCRSCLHTDNINIFIRNVVFLSFSTDFVTCLLKLLFVILLQNVWVFQFAQQNTHLTAITAFSNDIHLTFHNSQYFCNLLLCNLRAHSKHGWKQLFCVPWISTFSHTEYAIQIRKNLWDRN